MNWKELLKFSYKKPQLSEEETRALQKRETLYQKIENAYSRLESIEILNSNSKYEDSTILSGKLALDVLNIGLFLEDEAPIRSLMERETCKNKIKDTKLTQLIEDNEIQFQKLSGDSPPSGEEAETFETFLSQILYYEEKILKKLKNEELHTPIDDYKKRLTLHSILALLILGMGLYIPAKTYLKYRIQADTVNLYYFNEKFPLTENPGTENRIQQALLIDSNWHDYTFALPAPLQVSSIRFEPLHQDGVKFQIKSLKLLDAQKKVLMLKEFVVGNNNLLKEQSAISKVNHIIPSGKALPDQLATFQSKGNNPFFYLQIEKTENVAFIELKMRITKRKQFSE